MPASRRTRAAIFVLLCGGASCLAQPAVESRPAQPQTEPVKWRSPYQRTAEYLKYDLPEPPHKAAVIVLRGGVNDAFFENLRKHTDEALQAGCTLLIYELTTPGGEVGTTIEICKYLLETGRRARTAVYIPENAFSAGAIIAVSCQEIYLGPGAVMGASGVVSGSGQELDPVMRKKGEAVLTSYLENICRTNGYSQALSESMIVLELRVWAVKNSRSGEIHYFDEDRLPTDEQEWDLKHKVLTVSDKQLLAMTARKAEKLGFSTATVEDRGALLARLRLRGEPLIFEPPWIVDLLTNPLVTGLLMTVMLIAIFIEIRTPGVGMPGLIALACFVLLFGSHLVLGLAQWWAPLILILGVALLLIELFVTPGFGVLGITGILLVVGGLFGMFIPREGEGWTPNFLPVTQWGWEILQRGLIIVPSAVAAALAGILLIGRFLPKMPLLGRVVLKEDSPTRVTAAGVSKEGRGEQRPRKKQPQIGESGVVRSDLRPSGSAEFDGRLVDVVCDGDYIESGQRVEIVKIEGNRILVARVKS
jgi:membrane-bound serine protease (ClpP class)